MRQQKTPSTDWQKGYDLAHLKAVTAVISAHDGDLVLGAFTRTSERTVAQWLADGELHYTSQTGPIRALVVVTKNQIARKIKDFAGEFRGQIERGSVIIKKIACVPGAEDELFDLIKAHLAESLWFEGWMEHQTDRHMAELLELEIVGVKIRASSELWGVFGPSAVSGANPICAPADWPTLKKLLEGLDVTAAAEAVLSRPPRLADHYSTYNVKHTWSAAVLRGYGGRAEFIIKPSEMSKKWKEENAEKLAWAISDTSLRPKYPELEPLIDAIPGRKHRIRLMNLAPGGGELLRHADITDPDAGTRDGCLCRVHIPLVTNPGVEFTSWNLNGGRLVRHMAPGTAWYLDTRKPHRAINAGTSARLHLVIDVESSPEFRKLLGTPDSA